MQVNDELMWRYYELLTDVAPGELVHLRTLHPMEAKIELARRITSDFHPPAEVERAARLFDSVVRRHEVPPGIPVLAMPAEVRLDSGVRLDKMLARIGLADSVSDAVRKIKAGAVEINGRRYHDLVLPWDGAELLVQAGKHWRRISALEQPGHSPESN
jgi:tyrosyl-tRNA synthetase